MRAVALDRFHRPPALRVDLAGRSDSIAFSVSPRIQCFRMRLPI